MIFLDTNILIYLEQSAAPLHEWATEQVIDISRTASLVINNVTYAEFSRNYPDTETLNVFLHALQLQRADPSDASLHAAARAFKVYRAAGGPRERILPDFFIGADAMVAGAPLLTNDPLLYETYFPQLSLITP